VAVVWVGVGLFLVNIASVAWQSRGDRDSHFGTVAGYGFFVSHPGFRLENRQPYCCSHDLRSIRVGVQAHPRTASPLVPQLDLKLRLNLLNRLVGRPNFGRDLPVTGVDVAEAAAPSSPKAIGRLPSSVVATAIVEFRRPLAIADLYRTLQRHGVPTRFTGPDVAIFLQPSGVPPEPGMFARRVAWPNANVAQFQAWVKQLRTSDNGVLEDLEVPPVATLRTIAATPRISGVVLERATPKQLDGLLRDPAVQSVRLGDIGFAAAGSTE
jgi:hypothetical protein